jgi:hypothetical protein
MSLIDDTIEKLKSREELKNILNNDTETINYITKKLSELDPTIRSSMLDLLVLFLVRIRLESKDNSNWAFDFSSRCLNEFLSSAEEKQDDKVETKKTKAKQKGST